MTICPQLRVESRCARRENRLVFGAPVIGEPEIASVVDCLRSNWIGLGARVEQFEQEFARYKGCALCGRGQQRYCRYPSCPGRFGHWAGR